MHDPYLYDDCPVLQNKLGIKDNDLLNKAEVEFSCAAIHEYPPPPTQNNTKQKITLAISSKRAYTTHQPGHR